MSRRLNSFHGRILALIFLAAAGLACALPGLTQTQPTPSSRPQVTVSNPTPGQALPLDSEVKVLSTAIDKEGIARVELVIDGAVIRVDANAQPQPNTPFIVAQSWQPQPGMHLVQVRAYNTDNVAGESSPIQVQVTASVQGINPGLSPTAPAVASAPTVTLAPTATPERPETATPVPPSSPTPVARPNTPALTPTPTPTPGRFEPTGIEPQGRFYDIWQEVGGGKSRLGYPTGPEISGQNYAKQYFEKGLMYWWDNPDKPDFIWVIDSPAADLNSGTAWNRYPDRWQGDDPFSCDEARQNGAKGPVRGFGQVWCKHPELQQRLGNPWENETGSAGNPPFSQVQFFQGGVMLYNPINAEVFVLFDQGDWLRFGY